MIESIDESLVFATIYSCMFEGRQKALELPPLKCYTLPVSRHVGMADDADSKSVARKGVWVQVPLSAGRIPVVVPRGGEQPVFILHAR